MEDKDELLFCTTQVSEAIDGWQKFLDLHSAVMQWCSEKRELLDRPEEPRRLSEARQRSQDLQAAQKACRYAAKNLQVNIVPPSDFFLKNTC